MSNSLLWAAMALSLAALVVSIRAQFHLRRLRVRLAKAELFISAIRAKVKRLDTAATSTTQPLYADPFEGRTAPHFVSPSPLTRNGYRVEL